jgi:hypothetical protein
VKHGLMVLGVYDTGADYDRMAPHWWAMYKAEQIAPGMYDNSVCLSSIGHSCRPVFIHISVTLS